MITAHRPLMNSIGVPHVANYGYDGLNRIKSATYTGDGNANAYKTGYSYDANGNLMTLTRNNASGNLMDNLTYTYNDLDQPGRANNRLSTVSDMAGDATLGAFAGTATYTYDATGNLITDTEAGIEKIEWNVAGKIKKITFTQPGKSLTFSYDAMGNRIAKEVEGGDRTVYVRDASGNVLATYTGSKLSEHHLYGSSRLGVATRYGATELPDANETERIYTSTLGDKQYELSNHLGNVLATVSDLKTPNSGGSYLAKVESAHEYYPFGSIMPGRILSSSPAYRYGFNGKEKDNEVKGDGNSLDFGARIYDSRIGKWLSVDPLFKKFASLSPYNFAGNNPISFIDNEGEEFFIAIRFYDYKTNGYSTKIYKLNEKDIDSRIKDVYEAVNDAINYLGTSQDPNAQFIYNTIVSSKLNVTISVDQKTYREGGGLNEAPSGTINMELTNSGEVYNTYISNVEGLFVATYFTDKYDYDDIKSIQSPAVFPLSHEIGHNFVDYLLNQNGKNDFLSFESNGKKFYLTSGATEGEFVNQYENVESYGMDPSYGPTFSEHFATKIQNYFAKGLEENKQQYESNSSTQKQKKSVSSPTSTE